MPLKLESILRQRLRQLLFQISRHHFLRIRIQRQLEILPSRIRLRVGEQPVVQPHFRFQRVLGAHPGNRALDLVVVRAFGAAL